MKKEKDEHETKQRRIYVNMSGLKISVCSPHFGPADQRTIPLKRQFSLSSFLDSSFSALLLYALTARRF